MVFIMRNDSYRVKSRVTFGVIMLRIVIAAVILLVASLVLLYVLGVRYISTTTGEGLEIKFFDRLKALEKLAAIGGGEENSQSSFIKALSEGARLLSEEENI